MSKFLTLLAAFIFCCSAPALALQDEPTSTTQNEIVTGHINETMTLEEVFGDDIADDVLAMATPGYKIEFQAYIPPSYSADNPPGIMVFVSPARRAGPPRIWIDVLEQKNLIWVGVNKSGNAQDTAERIIEALASLKFATDRYNVDPRRVYLSGFSGGGRITSIMARFYAATFNGYIYFAGVNSWGPELPEQLELMKRNRFVFLTGSHDFNRVETKQVHREYLEEGFERTKLMVINGMRHQLPKAPGFEEAIDFLDSYMNADIPVSN